MASGSPNPYFSNMRGFDGMTRALSVVCVVALGAGLISTVPASAATPGVDISSIKVSPSSDSMGANGAMYLSVGLANAGDTSTSLPIALTFPNLPPGVTVASSPDSPGVTCAGGNCSYSGQIAGSGSVRFSLLAKVDKTVTPGTNVAFQVAADSSEDSTPAVTDSVNFKVAPPAADHPTLSSRLTADRPVVRGGKAVLSEVITNKAGKTANRVTLGNVVPKGSMVSVRGSGAGWKCSTTATPSCTYNRQLAVGQSSSPLRLKVQTSKKVAVKALSGGDDRSGQVGELRWKTSYTTPGAPARKLGTSLLFRLRQPVLPKVITPNPNIPNWTKVAHIETQLQTTGHLRAGGVRTLLLDTMYNKVSHTRGAVHTVIKLPAGTSLDRFVTKGWKCQTSAGGRRGDCYLNRTLRGNSRVPRIALRVKAEKSIARKKTVRVKASASWRATDGAHVDTDAVSVVVDPVLRVHAAKRNLKVIGIPVGRGPVTKRVVQLHAAIGGISTKDRPAYQWRQLAGPKVKWVGAKGHKHAGADASASFQAPSVASAQTLRFQVTATIDNAVATDVVTMKVKPRKVAVMRARVASTHNAALHAKGPGPIPDRSQWVGHRSRSIITITGPTRVRVKPGQKITLKPRVAGPATKYRWRVVSGSKKVLRGKVNGRTVTVKAPKKPGLTLVTLSATGRKHLTATRSLLIRVVPKSARSQAQALAIKDTSSEFCTLYNGDAAKGALNDPLKVQSGAGTLTPGAVTRKGSSCTDAAAAITFNAGSISYGTHTFVNVVGQLDASGLKFNAGTYKTPSSWAKALSYLGSPDLSFNTGSVPISAAWAATDLGLLTGSYTVNSFLFLKAPGGWTGTTTFSFTPSAPAQLGIDASLIKGAKKNGDVELTGSVGTDGTFSVNVSAANLVVLTTANGSQVTVSGTGKISLDKPSDPVTYAMSISLPGPIQLLTGFNLANIVVKWDETGVSLSADGSITASSGNVGLHLTGTYADDTHWSLAVAQTSPWVSSDVTISKLSGTVSDAAGTVAFTISGEASNISLPAGLSLTKATAVVTNTCPKGAKDCQTGAVRLAIDITGTVQVGGSAQPYSGSLDVDLSDMDVTFSAKVKAADFGPVGLNLSNITIGFDGKGNPLPTGTCSSSGPGGDTVTFSATIDSIFGAQNVPVTGVVGSLGYCISATLSQFAPTGNASLDGAFDGVAFIYSSYATQLNVPGLSKPVQVPAATAAVYGTFNTPQSLSGPLGGLSGQGVFHAILTDGANGLGFNGGIDYTFTNPLYLTGSADPSQSSLSMTQVSLKINVGAGTFDLTLAGDGNYYTPASSDGSSQASTVPLSLSVDIDFATLSFGFSATAAGGAPVNNAFGEAGLILNNLTISGSLGGSDSLAFAADAVLPQSWVASIGVQPGTPIGLVIDISATPCLQFTIGTASQQTPAINFMNEGTLIADYGNIVLAPLGCTFSDVHINPGFALDFHGLIGGDVIDFDASLTLGGSGFALKANVYIQTFSLGGVQLDNTTFSLDLDPSQSIFDINFASTIVVAGSNLSINGGYNQNGSTTTVTFQMASTGNVSIDGFTFNNANLNFTYTNAPSGTNMSFSLNGQVAFLGQSFNGQVAFTMTNGSVTAASGSFYIGLDVIFASVSGDLTFTYQQGQGASGTFTNGSVSAVGLDFYNVSGSLQANGAYSVTAFMNVPSQNASAADTWLYANEGGEFNTVFWGTLGIQITGGNGQSTSVTYDNSSVAAQSEWSTHTYTSYGHWVGIPNPGCPVSYVGTNGIGGTPEFNFWLNPVYTENASSDGDGDDDTNSCVSFSSQVFP